LKIDITPLILTFNEAPNLERTLSRLTWAKEIVVLDSGSTDATRAILSRYPAVRVVERAFTNHGDQWQYALEHTGITTEWILALDADFVLTDEILREMEGLQPPDRVSGYRASFDYCIGGTPLRGAAYPPVTVLYRRRRAHYIADGHAQRVQLEGDVVPFTGKIHHDDRKPLAGWLASQIRYMRLEADKISSAPPGTLSWPDRIRKLIVVAPAGMFVYCYVYKLGILDGKAGLFYSLQRVLAEMILSLYLFDRVLGFDAGPTKPS
jgi:glycosyltransferase involved in cell wall biosynthesis